jgi:hypothetical protein
MPKETHHLRKVEAKREGMSIVCVPDYHGLLAYALGFVCSDSYINEHDILFCANGPGLLVGDFLSITRLLDLSELPQGIEFIDFLNVESNEVWIVERPRGFDQPGAAIAIDGAALRKLFAQVRPMWGALKRELESAGRSL